jgi:hypothetical protein
MHLFTLLLCFQIVYTQMPASVSNAVLQFTAAAAASNATATDVNKSNNATANSSAAYSQSRLLALLQRIPSKTVDTGTLLMHRQHHNCCFYESREMLAAFMKALLDCA